MKRYLPLLLLICSVAAANTVNPSPSTVPSSGVILTPNSFSGAVEITAHVECSTPKGTNCFYCKTCAITGAQKNGKWSDWSGWEDLGKTTWEDATAKALGRNNFKIVGISINPARGNALIYYKDKP